ncbi:MAG: transcription elongation factor GreA [Herpetosiphonaceae bacterium]|nr:MAG: transcription elongation factor GreA [Herpetosiphonaceae bacterium]
MSEKPVYLTREGRAQLEAELEELLTVGRKQVQERIHQARDLGDISESGEYEDAKNQQAFVEGRILEIKNLLRKAQLIDEENGDNREVRLGSSVTVRYEDGDEETYTIVGSAEANPRAGKISNESPIGAALIGKRARQKISVQTPSGTMKLTIVRIR